MSDSNEFTFVPYNGDMNFIQGANNTIAAIVRADGKVSINWAVCEATAADPASSGAQLMLSRLMIAIRDNTYTSF
jgi:hypothetical protein